MQAALPDLNTAIIRYRIMITACIEREDYAGAIGGIYALNGLLPEDYRVRVSTEEFNEITKTNISIKCKHCSEEFDFYKIKVWDMLLRLIPSLLRNTKYEKTWNCPKCEKPNRLIDSEMKQTKISPNVYLHVMPEPLKREQGVLGRTAYHNSMVNWVWTFMGELEERCGKLRHDFLNRDEGMLEEITDEA